MTGSITFTITASAPSSFDLQFAATGLDSTALGSVVTFPTGEFTPASFGQLPVDEGSVTSGTVVNYAFASTLLSSNPGEQFALTNPPSPPSGFKISADTTVTGSYQKQDWVQFAASPNGGGTTTTSGWYSDGSSGNPISATPSGGFSFAGWTVLCVTGSSCITISGGSTITVNGPGTLIATFLPPSLDPTSTTLYCFAAASEATDYVGGEAFCTATVTDTAGGGATSPTGTVTFSSDASSTFDPSSSCTLNPRTSPSSSCMVNYFPSAGSEGLNSLTASYGGDSTHAGSQSGYQIEVYDRPTATSVTCTPPASGTETCTATVMDLSTYDESTPTGQVFFLTSGSGAFEAASGSTFDTGILGQFNGCDLSALPPGEAPNTIWA